MHLGFSSKNFQVFYETYLNLKTNIEFHCVKNH